MLGFSGSVSLRLEREAWLEMEDAFDHSFSLLFFSSYT